MRVRAARTPLAQRSGPAGASRRAAGSGAHLPVLLGARGVVPGLPQPEGGELSVVQLQVRLSQEKQVLAVEVRIHCEEEKWISDEPLLCLLSKASPWGLNSDAFAWSVKMSS